MRIYLEYKFIWDEGFEEFNESFVRLDNWLYTVNDNYDYQLLWPGLSEEDREKYYASGYRIPYVAIEIYNADDEFFVMLNLLLGSTVHYRKFNSV